MYLRENSSHVYIISPHPGRWLARKPVEPLWVRFAPEGRRDENYLLNWRMRDIFYNSAFCHKRPLFEIYWNQFWPRRPVINVAKHQVFCGKRTDSKHTASSQIRDLRVGAAVKIYTRSSSRQVIKLLFWRQTSDLNNAATAIVRFKFQDADRWNHLNHNIKEKNLTSP